MKLLTLATYSPELLAAKIAAKFAKEAGVGKGVELDAAVDLVELQRRIEQGADAFAAECRLEIDMRAATWKKPKARGGKRGKKKKKGKKGRR